jgi:uncharacterized membrane protein
MVASLASAAERSNRRPPLIFDAVLQPRRSLGPRGFTILMALLGTVSFAAGIGFVTLGAWPVVGFLGLDVLLVYVAFRLNYRAARDYETVQLTETTLHVARRGPLGVRESHAFQAHWVRVEMDDPPRHDSRLRLTSHGRSLTIGAFLTPDERLDFARALRAELARLRQPDFTR